MDVETPPDPEYRRLLAQHRDFESRLAELSALPHLTGAEEVERTNLKKYKLRLKDRMAALARTSRSPRG